MSKTINKFKKDITEMKKTILTDFSSLAPVSCTIIGSSTVDDAFVKNHSDIDLCVFSKNISDVENVLDFLKEKAIDFHDKPPRYIKDVNGPRIEFYVKKQNISFDITLLPIEIPKYDNSFEDSIRDNLDIHIGNIYKYGIHIHNQPPLHKFVEKHFLPFYSKELRERRLSLLSQRLEKSIEKTKSLREMNSNEVLDYFYKTRHYFIKWLFIEGQKYPRCLDKYLGYQLKEILGLEQEDISTVLGLNGNGLFQIIDNFNDVAEKHLSASLRPQP